MKKIYRKSTKLYRPFIDWRRIGFYVMISTIVAMLSTIIVCTILEKYGLEDKTNRMLQVVKWFYLIPVNELSSRMFLLLLTLIALTNSKKILIFMVKVYQCYAPDDIRLSCRFVPSCSEYMIMAIEKYGVIKGIIKGLNRLSRCHAPNGGEDYP